MSQSGAASAAQRRAGFTLVEAVIAMAIVSIALVTISQMLAFGIGRSSDGLSATRSVRLAESYLEEIMGRKYAEPTPDGGVPPCSASSIACGPIGSDSGASR